MLELWCFFCVWNECKIVSRAPLDSSTSLYTDRATFTGHCLPKEEWVQGDQNSPWNSIFSKKQWGKILIFHSQVNLLLYTNQPMPSSFLPPVGRASSARDAHQPSYIAWFRVSSNGLLQLGERIVCSSCTSISPSSQSPEGTTLKKQPVACAE